MKMRTVVVFLVLAASAVSMGVSAQQPAAPAPAPAAPANPVVKLPREPVLVGSINDLMAQFVYPTGDEVFYVRNRFMPKDDKEWNTYQANMLMLAETGNLLMMPGRARDNDRWMRDARLLIDAAQAAYNAAKKHDVAAIEKLNDQMYSACVVCHQDYRPNYRTRVDDPEGLAPLQPLTPMPARGGRGQQQTAPTPQPQR